MSDSTKKREYQRASFRFDYDVFNEFRDVCRKEGFKQAPLLEKFMRDFIIKIKVLQPAKHLAIQEKRKKWLEAREISDRLLAEYKEEKGDYYKNK